ncbi:hypothetical protein [Aquimarina longa]|uniref:hypothetical protein n=1 Tax=Aquimarina longa TaxID=1080221 RepID=UPI0007808569|nr:hypothetical protein [Aquimarina longa]
MKNLAIRLENKLGALAKMGKILGNEGVSLEGGGVFVYHNIGVANFLVKDAEKGKKALESHGIEVFEINDVLIQKLDQETPGQLGKICDLMEKNRVNIITQYSDHENQLILVVDDYEKGKVISENWSKGIYK